MAVPLAPAAALASHRRMRHHRLFDAAYLAALTLFAFLLLGYHPFAEDGGIYTAAVNARLHPALFPHDRVWVTAHTRFALFVPLVAAIARALHLTPEVLLFALQLAGLFALLAAASHLARTCFPSHRHAWFAALTVATGAGLPVAGTALYAVDPYGTARTCTTPLLVFACSLALRHRWTAAALCMACAAAMHPLMAIWGSLPLLLLAALHTRHPRRWSAAVAAAVLLAATVLTFASPGETEITRAIAHTRAYWFPAQWRWYEWLGAVAPAAILIAVARTTQRTSGTRKAEEPHADCSPQTPAAKHTPKTPLTRPTPDAPLHRLASDAATTTALAIVLSLGFAREGARTLAIARLQPLRSLHLIFVVFLAVLGAFLQTKGRTTRRIALASCAIAAASLFLMQRALYPHTAHLEWPGRASTNPWQAAFLWCRSHTPPDALFALDANYIDLTAEDSHGFRAIALRSTLPDGVKDAGIAAVLPALSTSWQTGVSATRNLDRATDTERRGRLLPLGVTWLVLPATSTTALPCPYRNAAAQVCSLR